MSDFETLSHFDILELNEYSDHAPISFNIQLLREQTQTNDEQDFGELEISRKIVWDNEKVIEFQTSLMNKNGHIQQFMSDVSTEPIDDVVNTFRTFYTTKHSIRLVKHIVRKNQPTIIQRIKNGSTPHAATHKLILKPCKTVSIVIEMRTVAFSSHERVLIITGLRTKHNKNFE